MNLCIVATFLQNMWLDASVRIKHDTLTISTLPLFWWLNHVYYSIKQLSTLASAAMSYSNIQTNVFLWVDEQNHESHRDWTPLWVRWSLIFCVKTVLLSIEQNISTMINCFNLVLVHYIFDSLTLTDLLKGRGRKKKQPPCAPEIRFYRELSSFQKDQSITSGWLIQ